MLELRRTRVFSGCNNGESCPAWRAAAGLRCSKFADCEICPVGNVSLGNENCYPCGEPGKAANSDNSMCITCSSGQEPRADRTQCDDCSNTKYSTFGISCEPCALGFQPDDFRVTCVDVNECAVANGGCDPLAVAGGESCVNNVGNYRCGECPLGFNTIDTLDDNGRTNGSSCLLPEMSETGGAGAGSQAQVQPAIRIGMEVTEAYRNAHDATYGEGVEAALAQQLTDSIIASVDLGPDDFSVRLSGDRRHLQADSTLTDSDSGSWGQLEPEPEPEPELEPEPEPGAAEPPDEPDESNAAGLISFDIVVTKVSLGSLAAVGDLTEQLQNGTSAIASALGDSVSIPAGQDFSTDYSCPRGTVTREGKCWHCNVDEYAPEIGASCRPCPVGQVNKWRP